MHRAPGMCETDMHNCPVECVNQGKTFPGSTAEGECLMTVVCDDCAGHLDLADLRIIGYEVPKNDPLNVYVYQCDDCGKIYDTEEMIKRFKEGKARMA